MKYAIVVFEIPFPDIYGSTEQLVNMLARIKQAADSIAGASMLAGNVLVLPLLSGPPQLLPDLPALVQLLHEMKGCRVKYHMIGLEEMPSPSSVLPQP